MIRRIDLQHAYPDDWVQRQRGKLLTDDHYDTVIEDEDVDVYKPDGSPLFKLRTHILPAGVCQPAYGPLRKAARAGKNNRRTAGGGSYRKRRKDGTLSSWIEALPAECNILGFFPKKYGVAGGGGGVTSYTKRHLAEFDKVIPLARACDRVFNEWMPDRYDAQMEMVRRTDPCFVIADTAFTTITVNRNWQIAVHIDAGDYPDGFGVLSLLRGGSFTGGLYCYPKYGIAVNLKTRDVLLADVHEPHGTTPIVGDEYDRIMAIFYYATKMAERCPRVD